MAANQVQVDLIANDLISSVITGIKSNLAGLGSSAGEASGQMQVFWGTFTGNLATRAVDLVTQGFHKLTGAIMEATKAQTDMIATSSDLGTNLGVSLPDAKKLVKDTQSELADIAAALPGETEGYNQVFNAISATVAKYNVGNIQGFKEQSIDMTKRVAALAAIRNSSAMEAGSAWNRLLSGTSSFSEISLNDILQKNPQLTGAIRSETEKMGLSVAKWKNFTQSQRTQILTNALKVAAPDQLFKEFDDTLDSYIQNWKTKLFNPLKGAFGMMRTVKGAGGRSVLDTALELVKTWSMVADGVGSIAEKLGLNFDVLQPVVKLMDFLRDIGARVNFYVTGLTRIPKLSTGDVFIALRKLVYSFVDSFNSVLRRVVQGTMDVSGFNVGGTLANFANGVFTLMSDSIARVDWVALGGWLGTMVYKAFTVIAGIVMNFNNSDYQNVMNQVVLAAVKVVLGFFSGLVIAPAKDLFSAIRDFLGFLKAGFDGLMGFIQGIFDRIRGVLNNIPGLGGGNPIQTVVSKVADAVPGGGLLKAGMSAFNKLLGKDTVEKADKIVGEGFSGFSGLAQTANNTISTLPLATPPTFDSPSSATNTQNTQVFSPNVSVSGSDPKSTADEVMKRMEKLYGDYQRTNLGAK